MKERFSLDTNILVKAFLDYEIEHRNVLAYIENFILLLDYENSIYKEYLKNCDCIAFQKWWCRLQQKDAFYFVSGKLNRKHLKKLKKLGCHESKDYIFIAVAYNGKGSLISEDSDFGKGIKGVQSPYCNILHYIQNTMGIKVFNAAEALELLISKIKSTI